jgi:hypothetical protein
MNGVENWHDFYLTTGASAACIFGATFIVATLVTNLRENPNVQRGIGLKGFITPTAVHLGSVLTGSVILLMPTLRQWELVAAFAAGGIAGIVYCVIVWTRIKNMPIDIPDRIFYAALPFLLYAAIVVGAVLVALDDALGIEIFGIAFLVLLMIGVRNAWDMATFMIMFEERNRPKS